MNQSNAAHDASIQRIGGIVMQVAGPALAMLVVYSIAGFLIEIFYGSALVGRVKWIFLLFSFAAVLISRISIEEGYERATGFGLALGLAVLLVSSKFLQGNPIFLAGILTFVWWTAGRLTWDCTFIDNSRDATGKGMIDLAIDRVEKFRKGEKADPDEYKNDLDGLPPDPDLVQGVDKKTKRQPTAWDKFVGIFWKRKQANTPGLWAFYFLLMGLPFFGLGQVMLRMTDQVAHNAAVMHFFWYVTGLLGLLMLTSVLGLHRYLQANQSSMPGRLARKWIIAGALLAFCITGFCLLLPRPTASYSVGHWLPKLTSKNTTPSDQSFGDDGQEQGENNSNVKTGPKSRDNRGERKGEDSESQGGNERKSDQGAPKDTKGGDTSGGKSDGKKGAGGKKKGSEKKGSKSDSKNKSRQKGNESGDKDTSDNKGQKSEKSDSGKKEKGKGDKSGEEKSKKDKQGLKTDNQGNRKKKTDQKKNGGRKSSSRRQRPPPESQPKQNQQESKKKKQQQQEKKESPNLMAMITKFFQLIIWIAALLLIGWFAIKHRERIMPWIKSFIAELVEFWNRLWNRKKKTPAEVEVEKERRQKAAIRLPGFDKYSNPFASDAASRWAPDRLVTYTFEAFEAWSRDHQCAREPDQTAHEFAKITGSQFQQLNQDAAYLAGLYSQLAYAQGRVSRSAAMALSPFWEKLIMMYSPHSAATS